jgi:hypothetical protein
MASKRPPSTSRRDRNRNQTTAASVLVLRLVALSSLSLMALTFGLPKGGWFPEKNEEDTEVWAQLDDDSGQNSAPGLDFGFNDRPPSQSSPNAKPVRMISRTIAGIPIYLAAIDLSDPETFISVGLANRASRANSARSTRGDEAFVNFVRRHQAAITMSGTFFSMDAQKRVMGNLVSGGEFLKYSPWENYGTTLGVKSGNQLEMITARIDGKPKWQKHWFSLTAGPRLLRQGKLSIQPKREGFADPAVMGSAVRSAIGFTPNRKKILHVTFTRPVSLRKEAEIMQALGCWEAMNLDGGTSLALAKGNRILRGARRNLTNVITIYDVKHPAPQDLRLSWRAFQNTDRIAER